MFSMGHMSSSSQYNSAESDYQPRDPYMEPYPYPNTYSAINHPQQPLSPPNQPRQQVQQLQNSNSNTGLDDVIADFARE